MNGYDIFKKAVTRAGIFQGDILNGDFAKRAPELINQIAADLKLEQINSLSDEIICDTEKAEALCCGVAMLVTLTVSDREKNEIFTNIYNAKRAAVLSNISAVEDVLPNPADGGFGSEV